MRIRRYFGFAVIALVPALALRAQTTGSVAGRTLGENGDALPGVSVEATGPALQGAQTAVTDSRGAYRLPVLPPGRYQVSAILAGFATEKKSVTVALGGTSVVDFQMKPSAKESVIVTGEAPVIDTTSTTIGTNLDQHLIQTIPTDRNFASIAQVTPGISSDVDPYNPQNDSSSLSVYGSSSSENSYVIDGVDTSGVEYGTQGTDAQLRVHPGGRGQDRRVRGRIRPLDRRHHQRHHEVGRQRVPRRGLRLLRQRRLQACTEKRRRNDAGRRRSAIRQKDFGADLGGFVLKDRLWFFGAYDRVDNTVKNVLTDGPSDRPGVRYRSRRGISLPGSSPTGSATPASIVGSYFQDPRVDTRRDQRQRTTP